MYYALETTKNTECQLKIIVINGWLVVAWFEADNFYVEQQGSNEI